MNRWIPDGRGTDRRGALTGRQRSLLRWTGLFLGWVLVTGLLSVLHLGLLIWPLMVALILYVVVDILRSTPPTRRPLAHGQASVRQPQRRFNPAPGWPAPPAGWTPPPGWEPDPSWAPAPPGWRFWQPESRGGPAEGNRHGSLRDPDSWR